jgi:CheY-like chemotaxis protein
MNKNLRILVAEDDPNDTLFLQRAFAKAGVEVPVRFVRDGQEAIDYLQQKEPFADAKAYPRPTLLLLDLNMPRLDGFEVLDWLRQQPHLGKPLVVVFSSSPAPEDRNRASTLGAHAYLVKPADPRAFVTVVRELEQYWLRFNDASECAVVTLDNSQQG